MGALHGVLTWFIEFTSHSIAFPADGMKTWKVAKLQAKGPHLLELATVR